MLLCGAAARNPIPMRMRLQFSRLQFSYFEIPDVLCFVL